MELAPGTKIGAYELLDRLGGGAMGAVYRARDPRLDRDVAIKILAARSLPGADAVARFRREARAASALNHPHILHVYEVGAAEAGDGALLHYIAMELVDGETLRRRLDRPTSERQKTFELLLEVADALTKAHASGIVHRDLKPDNIMITRDGYAKVVDFGLAKPLRRVLADSLSSPAAIEEGPAVATGLFAAEAEEAAVGPDAPTLPRGAAASETAALGASAPGDPSRTLDGMLIGTAGYMAPEQARGLPAEPRSDIFAFGSILYEAATGSRAFEAEGLAATLRKVIHEAPPRLDRLEPEALRPIVRRCLEKDPERRYPSMRELARELRQALALTATATTAPLHTVAVLPFDDLSPGRDHEHLSDGLTEEIISGLSTIRSLRVIARASVMRYRGERKDIRRAASELAADRVVDGSVRKAGERLRITAALIDAGTGEQLWSETYAGTLDDVFAIQEKVARDVAASLEVRLSASEERRLAERPIADPVAYECYLKARREILKFSDEGLTAALRHIEEGLQLAGENVALLAARAYAYWQYYNAGLRPDPAYLDRAEALGHRIFELEPDSAHGHRILGLVAVQRQRVGEAIEHLGAALAADPYDPDALAWYGVSCLAFDRPEKTEIYERLARIDPLSGFGLLGLGYHRVLDGDFEGGAPDVERAYRVDPSPMTAFFYAHCLALLRRDASEVLVYLDREATGSFYAKMARALHHAAAGEREPALAQLDAELLAAARADLQYSSFVADVYARLGERDQALDWLENSIDRGWAAWRFFSTADWLLDPLRGDPRFEALLTRARQDWERLRG